MPPAPAERARAPAGNIGVACAMQPSRAMTTPRKLAFVLFLVADVALLTAGVVYAAVGRALPYHEQALGQPWEELEPQMRELYLLLCRAVAIPTIAVGIAILGLLLVPWRRGSRFARLFVPIVSLVYAVPMFLLTLRVHEKTGAATPYPLLAAGIALVVIAALLSLVPRSARAGAGKERASAQSRHTARELGLFRHSRARAG